MSYTRLADAMRTHTVMCGEMNDIMMFDAEGHFVSRASKDIPLLKKQSFFELLSQRDAIFFNENSRDYFGGRLLLDSKRGPLLIFCRPYAETGLFVGFLFHVKRESMRRFWKWGVLGDVKVSPTLVERTPTRRSGAFEEGECIERRLGLISGVFDDTAWGRVDRNAEGLIGCLAGKLRALARLVGCALVTSEYDCATPAEGYIFGMVSYLTMASALLSLACRALPRQTVKAAMLEQDGRYFVTMEMSLCISREKPSCLILSDMPELDYCRAHAARRDLIFEAVLVPGEKEAKLSVRFSPDFRDPALLGLKNPFEFYE